MDAQEQRFIAEYIVDFNPTAAAIRAGYAESEAEAAGRAHLMNPTLVEEAERRVCQRFIDRVRHEDEQRRAAGRLQALAFIGKLAGDQP